MKSRGLLKKDTVVGTVMTNMGFSRFCEDMGMNFVSTQVGDRYVLETMIREGYNIEASSRGTLSFSTIPPQATGSSPPRSF